MTDNTERARIIAELRWLADKREEYKTDVFPQIQEQADTARQLADILERHEPVSEGGTGWGWLPSWRWDEWDQMAHAVEPHVTDAAVQRLREALYAQGLSYPTIEQARTVLAAALGEPTNHNEQEQSNG